jgi:hypothetical protein
MADHYYSKTVGDLGNRDPSNVTIGTSTLGGSKIELRITDGALTRRDAYRFCELLADWFASESGILPTGGFTG